jgi:Spx/MgsR family transcriptional regulator
MSVTIYGIKNCDTMKKARAWLDEQGVDYSFHDYRTDGIDPERLKRWCREAGWEKLLNRAGTTFRKLPDAEKSRLDADKAMRLMLEQPAMIKRPVLEIDASVLVGFDARVYASAFASRGPRFP